MVTLKARKLTLDDAQRLLGFSPIFEGDFESYLSLPSLASHELSELADIRDRFLRYLTLGKVSEGQARELSVAPLLQLAGYHNAPIYLRIEEEIDRIYIESEETHITGRFDIVAVNREETSGPISPLWILVIESKNIEASEYVGTAQLLAYAHGTLEQQGCLWGLVTNGATYQFFYLEKSDLETGDGLTYRYMPTLNLRETDRSALLLQVLKSIRDWKPV
jgi:hypothetical protein